MSPFGPYSESEALMDALPGSDLGLESVRLSAREEDALARAGRQVAARRNLAALLIDRAGGLVAVARDKELSRAVAVEFEELSGLLGLEKADERTVVGICARTECGKSMYRNGAGGPYRAARRAGYCSPRCQRIAGLHSAGEVG